MSVENRSDALALADRAVAAYEQREFAACESFLEQAAALAPGALDLSAFRLLAKLKTARGEPDGARAVMQGALTAHPGKTEFVAAYADTLPPQEAIATLERHLTDVRDPGRAAYLLLRLTTIRAPLARHAQNRPADHGLSWPDTFQWPDAAALPALKKMLDAEIAAGSRRATARLDLAYIAVSESDWETAERHLADLRDGPKRTPADFTAFGAAFHAGLDGLSEASITDGLAPVQRLLDRGGAAGTAFLASDPRYFTDFTAPFLRQLEAAQLPLAVHVHLLDGNDPEWEAARAVLAAFTHVKATLTAEASGANAQGRAYARNYYHAVRYVRLYQELKRSQQPMWMLDCDVQLLRDPRGFLASLSSYDLAVRTNPCSFEPMLKVTASCVGISPTERGLEFARRVAASIMHWKKQGTWNWGVDQIALFSSYAHMSTTGREPRTRFLDNMAVNDKIGDTGTLRFMSGIDKFAIASGI